jgi:hypothetical protein
VLPGLINSNSLNIHFFNSNKLAMQLFKHAHYYAAVLVAGTFLAGCNKDSRAPQPTKAATTTASTTGEMVMTPAGLMPKSRVHFVEPGTELRVYNGHIQKIESASHRLLQDFGEVSITNDPIHNQTSGTTLDLSRAGDPGVVPKAVNGWAAYTYWSNTATTKPITSFTTSWTVPAAPSTKSDQTIFLFNGMQDGETASSYIIQPVLQWGESAAGGGSYWAITNWYVSSASAFYGTLETVTAGTKLTGVMTETGASGSDYNYSSVFTGYPAACNITVSAVPEAYWAAETLEVYSVKKAAQYPDATSMAFSSIQILQGTTNATIKWTAATGVTTALPKAVVNSDASPNGEVTIDF